MSYIPPKEIPAFTYSAAGAIRTSQKTTLLDGKTLGEDDVFLFQNVGTGTPTYANNKVTLAVTPGQYLIRQTKRYYPYFSGKPQSIEFTMDGFGHEVGSFKRSGYFSSNAVAPYDSSLDGFFIEKQEDGTFIFKAYRFGTETMSVLFTDFDNWDLISGIDFNNFNIFNIDFLWLGGSSVRIFMKLDTGFELIHEEPWASHQTDTFIGSPNQPLRQEIRSSSGAGSMRIICSEISTEGSINESGKPIAIFDATGITCNSVGTIYALKSVKKQDVFRDTAIRIIDMSVSKAANTDAGILMLIINPTVSAPITYANKSKLQEGTPTNQTITANTGRVIAAVTIEGGSSKLLENDYFSWLSTTIDNTHDEYVFAYMPTTSNQVVTLVTNLKEY